MDKEEEVAYLMARGLTRTEATATIVRRFLRVDIGGIAAFTRCRIAEACGSQ